MLTEAKPFRADALVGDSAERAAGPRVRVTPNSLIVLAGIAVLVAVLIFLEWRIGHLAINFSAVRESGTTSDKQPQLAGKIGSPRWQ
jgi:hypothetical protein